MAKSKRVFPGSLTAKNTPINIVEKAIPEQKGLRNPD
jgi:hypothetical protein